MTIYIFVLKGDLNEENRSGAFLFLSGIVCGVIITIASRQTFIIIFILKLTLHSH